MNDNKNTVERNKDGTTTIVISGKVNHVDKSISLGFIGAIVNHLEKKNGLRTIGHRANLR